MMMRRVLFGFIAMAVLFGALRGGWAYWQTSRTPAEARYKTAPVERRPISARVTASGTVQATVTVQVGAQISGRIATLFADFNSEVKRGRLLAKLDPHLYTAVVAREQASHSAAKASLARAEAQQRDAEIVARRTRSLHEQSVISAADLLTAETNVKVTSAATEAARATLEQTAAALSQAHVNLSYTDIVSPIDGIVISRNVDVGQTVASSFQAPVLFTIAGDLRKMQVHASVAEADIGRVRPGMEVTFTADAYPQQRFKGTIREIRNAAQTVQNVVTYDAVIDADNEDLRLRPGMTVTVTIVWAERVEALSIPNAALRFRPPDAPTPPSSKAGPALWVLRSGAAHPVSIQTGISDGTSTEVVSGELSPADAVILEIAAAPARPSPPRRAP